MNIIPEAEELFNVGKEIGIDIELQVDDDAKAFIKTVLNLFTPFKINGHLGIGNESIKLPIEEWEYSYMEHLCKEKGYIFFGQENDLSKKTLVKIGDLQQLGKILQNSFGMEYFLTNENMSFLVAVNWYVIEITGTIIDKFEKI